MPRFVVLEHDHPELHWDFMLEEQGELATWRLSSPPAAGGPIAAEPLPPHRLAYLDYEGPISGNRGTVTRWDRGEYKPVASAPTSREVQLFGGKLRGMIQLDRNADELGWKLIYRPETG